MSGGESVKVIVRCRPMNGRETGMGCATIISMDNRRGNCEITNPQEPSHPPKSFAFDAVYFLDSTAEQIYTDVVFPLVENVLEGYNGTVFAYGQTGSGKTFSMQGPPSPPAQRGIIPRTFEHIFEATATSENRKFLVHASYLEIYNEEIRDLLGNATHKLDVKEHPEKGVYVAGLSMHAVHNVKECDDLMGMGLKNRHTGKTLMNADSSRSHSIFSMYVEMMETREDGEHIRTGKLHLVDLAGSERQSKTGATGDTFKEATKINLSLSALGNVISALVESKSKHIPYRDSKLTRLLQDSLGGNTKTLMVACLSPADNNYDESLSTLRYANRAKNIKNKPKINEDPKDALLREYQEEIERLKSMLGPGGGSSAAVTNGATHVDLEAEKKKIREEYEQQMQEIKAQFHEEKKSNASLTEEMQKLKRNYESAMAKVEGPAAPNSSPTHQTAPGMDSKEAMKSQSEAVYRLEKLQQQVVGGEEANNQALKQKRLKKKQFAEKRQEQLAEALSKVDSDDPMLQVYNSVQDKLTAATKQLDREKKKVRSLENEIQDLQSEFELDRIDYLDTIRRQDQQLKLLQQVLEKVQPTIRRDSNYANLEKIKKEAVWDEDLQKWHLPEVSISKTQLPGGIGVGGLQPGGRIMNTGALSPRQTNGYSNGHSMDEEDSRLYNKLTKSTAEDAANNYFKPLRANKIISKNEKDKNRTDNHTSHFPSNRKTWDHMMNGVIYTDDIYERHSPSSSSPPGIIGAMKKPQRLEALGSLQSAKPRRSKVTIH